MAHLRIIPRHIDSKHIWPLRHSEEAGREAFYNTDVVHLIPSSSTSMILAVDFNCVITNDDWHRTAELQQSACETHTGTGAHRRMGGDSNTNCTHTLHCYWRFQDLRNLHYSWPNEGATRCGDGGCCLHRTFCSNPALDHGCTMLPSWERVLAYECIFPEWPILPTNNEGELGKMVDTYEI